MIVLACCEERRFLLRSVHGIFIDGDHSYEAVRADLAAWEPKLVPGGILAGHDFGNNDQVFLLRTEARIGLILSPSPVEVLVITHNL